MLSDVNAWGHLISRQMALLQAKSGKVEQENKFMAEALEDLQDSTSRLEAENRALKMSASPTGRSGASGSASSGKVGPSVKQCFVPLTGTIHAMCTSSKSTSIACVRFDFSLYFARNDVRAEQLRLLAVTNGAVLLTLVSSLIYLGRPLPKSAPRPPPRAIVPLDVLVKDESPDLRTPFVPLPMPYRQLAQSARTRSTPSKSRSAGGDIPPVTHVSATGDPATGEYTWY